MLEHGRVAVQVFTARYRVKFLQLVDIFLASSMIPAYSAAAFAKKFARLSVSAPPVGALACLAFVHNLIRRNPSCMCLLHRPKSTAGESTDPYDPEAKDMDDSKGVESTLWELSAIKVHLDPTVWIAHALLCCYDVLLLVHHRVVGGITRAVPLACRWLRLRRDLTWTSQTARKWRRSTCRASYWRDTKRRCMRHWIKRYEQHLQSLVLTATLQMHCK